MKAYPHPYHTNQVQLLDRLKMDLILYGLSHNNILKISIE